MRAPGSPWRQLINASLVGRLTAAGAAAAVLVVAACPGEAPRAAAAGDQAAQLAIARRVTAVAPASRSLVRRPTVLVFPLAPLVRAVTRRTIPDGPGRARVRARVEHVRVSSRARPARHQVRHHVRHRAHRGVSHRLVSSRPVPRAVAHRAARKVVRVAAGASAVVRFAYAQLGRPYVRNGSGRGGWDCSGLTKAAYARMGKTLTHKAARQNGTPVPRRLARPGDLVKWGSYHVGIYVGGGRVIHAPKPGDHVKRSRLWGSYRIVRVR